MYKSKGYKKSTTRKLAAARIAVNRASTLLRARTASRLGPLGPGATRGFYGVWNKRGRNELKSIDNSLIVTAPITTAGSVTLLNGVATGTDYVNRIGRKVIMKSLLMRVNFYPIGSTTNGILGENIRYMILVDSQPNGALPSVTDILNNAGPNEPINLSNLLS